MPAAAVIPASAASIKVAAVKRLAVECQYRAQVRWTLGRGNKRRGTGVLASLLYGASLYRTDCVSHEPPSVTSLLACVHIGIGKRSVFSPLACSLAALVLLRVSSWACVEAGTSSSFGFIVTLSKSECSKQS